MSRVHKIGNIFTRVDGLIRKNHLSEIYKPVWFDVYKQFPPKYEPTFKRMEPDMNVKEILYQEDVLRAKIHKEFEGQLGVFNLLNNEESKSQRLLKSCMDYISQGMSEDEAINKLRDSFGLSKKKKIDRDLLNEPSEEKPKTVEDTVV